MSKSDVLWEPTQLTECEIENFRKWLNQKESLQLKNYRALHQWSIDHIAKFWGYIAAYCQMGWQKEPSSPLMAGREQAMLGQKWFPDARLNYAENLLTGAQHCTIESYREGCPQVTMLTGPTLCGQVYDLTKQLVARGIGPQDRIAAVSANTDLTLSAMLATATLGATWASCSPDFGNAAIIDRMSQLQPKALFFTSAYEYGGQRFDCMEKLPKILAAIPTIEIVIILDHLPQENRDFQIPVECIFVSDILSGVRREVSELEFCPVPFDHPLFILFSSGTTGVPKCIIHSVGGTLLQHKKEHILHSNLGANSKLLYFTTCGWMMWNWMVSALASRSSLVLYEGSVHHPKQDVLWDLVNRLEVTHFGTSPKFLAFTEKSQIIPRERFELSALQCLLSTGSPLLPEQFDWIYHQVKKDIHVASICGGTDIISCFMLGSPSLPVRRGKIQCLGLGMAVEAWDDNRQAVHNQKGELVCTKPFPSMPIGFYGDHNDAKYRAAYFDYYPDRMVWRHGDFIEIDSEGMIQVFGRSDATLNPGGVRIGTAEIYRVVESCDFVRDSICIGVPTGDDVAIWLFVVLNDDFPAAWVAELKRKIKGELSPRHVPARIESVKDIPYTRSGKKVELAVRSLVTGEEVKNIGALRNPESLDLYRQFS